MGHDMTWINESACTAATSSARQFAMKEFKQSCRLAREMMEWAEFEIPKHKFIEYEMKDREWLEYFGFIKKRPRFDELHLHPETMKQLADRVGNRIEADLLYGVPLYSNSNVPVGVCMGFDSRPYRINSFGAMNVAAFE
jgi:hypothetical protein